MKLWRKLALTFGCGVTFFYAALGFVFVGVNPFTVILTVLITSMNVMAIRNARRVDP